METFLFTFGLGSDRSGVYQPIKAEDPNAAREIMCKEYGTQWAFQYTQEQFDESVARGFFNKLRPLPTLPKE